MTYALKLSDSAIAGLQSLPLLLQEETLDQIDTLTMDVKRPRKPDIRPLVHDFVREQDQATYYVFVRYRINHATKTIHVRTIGSHMKPTV